MDALDLRENVILVIAPRHTTQISLFIDFIALRAIF
jgi:hypothetical protein